MDKVINELKRMKKRGEREFIKFSLIKRACSGDGPQPDTSAYLDTIYELNMAISILENHGSEKNEH